MAGRAGWCVRARRKEVTADPPSVRADPHAESAQGDVDAPRQVSRLLTLSASSQCSNQLPVINVGLFANPFGELTGQLDRPLRTPTPSRHRRGVGFASEGDSHGISPVGRWQASLRMEQ
jgi:hypothetical protein